MFSIMPIRLKLTNHFQARQIERGISIDHVRQAIMNPDEVAAAYDGKTKVRKTVSDTRTIEVIYSDDGFRDAKNAKIVVTAYYL